MPHSFLGILGLFGKLLVYFGLSCIFTSCPTGTDPIRKLIQHLLGSSFVGLIQSSLGQVMIPDAQAVQCGVSVAWLRLQ